MMSSSLGSLHGNADQYGTQIKRNRRYGFTLVEIMIVVALIGLLAAIAVPYSLNARATSQQNLCIDNLRQIDSAKQQWALENRQAGGVTPSENEIASYLNRSGATNDMVCPADPGHGAKRKRTFNSSYHMNAVTEPPTCRIAPTSHALPQ